MPDLPISALAGGDNVPDAAGTGSLPAPPPTGIPSVSSPAPAPTPPVDPRLAAVLAQLQPQPKPAWQQVLQKIAPIIGGAIAMHEGAGGAFANEWQQVDRQNQAIADQKAQEQLRLATILHQQQLEQIANDRIEAAAQKEQAKKTDDTLREAWKTHSQSGLIDTINDIIKNQGQAAADKYMATTHIGSLTDDGIQHTVKDLVDRYAVKAPDGTLLGGKVKTPKETKAGTLEDYVSNAETIAAKKAGRDLTDEERQAVDQSAITQYKGLSKDPDDVELSRSLKRVQLTLDNLRADQIRTQVNDMKKSQGEIVEGTKEFGIARDLAYGILSYPDFARMYAFQRSGREQMRMIYDKAREINPNFSPALFEQGARFAGSPQTRRSMAAITNVESGVPSMIAASDAATRSNIKAINQNFVIPAGVQIGDKTYADLQAAHKAFADELSLALGVGTASDLKTKLGLDIADPNLSPEAFKDVLQTQVIPFLLRRKESLQGQMGPYGTLDPANPVPPTNQPQQNPNDPYTAYVNRKK